MSSDVFWLLVGAAIGAIGAIRSPRTVATAKPVYCKHKVKMEGD